MRPSGRRATISVKVPPRSIQNCHFSTSKVSHKRAARSDLDPRRIVYNRPKSRTMLTERVDAVVVGAGVAGLPPPQGVPPPRRGGIVPGKKKQNRPGQQSAQTGGKNTGKLL